MKGTTFNSPLFLQVCNSNVFGNFALKTKIGHVPTCMYEFVVELFFLQRKKNRFALFTVSVILRKLF